MTTLTEFLLERIAEDEAAARAAVGERWQHGSLPGHVDQVVPADYITLGDVAVAAPPTSEHIIRHDPARVLAECEAKRRIVERYDELRSHVAAFRSPRWADAMNERDKQELGKSEARHRVAEDMVHALALPYANHPSWREEWRP